MDESPLKLQTVAEYVVSQVSSWARHYEDNYEKRHEEYYRIWRGIWAAQDKERSSERSQIISPATQQAVESAVAEIEEATFGRGAFFDIEDDPDDKRREDIDILKRRLNYAFGKAKVRKDVGVCLLASAVWGTGIAEVVVEPAKEQAPATQAMPNLPLKAIGVMSRDTYRVRMVPVLPHQFRIDPSVDCVDDAHGVAIERFVPYHSVVQLQEQGIYLPGYVGTSAPDDSLEDDKELLAYPTDGRVKLTKYFGLIPRYFYEDPKDPEDKKALNASPEAPEGDSEYVESIVVIANDTTLLKIEPNPYMMQDRPIIAFPWDPVPGRFWGRGICEKAYNSQKALDAELRSRIDGLALTIHPMMGIDASRVPRGADFSIRPGRNIFCNGPPGEIFQPINFGNINQTTFAQAAQLADMVQKATGAIDSTGIQGSINGEAAASAVSMSLGAIIKRHKRTLVNFQESFLIPFVEKAAWRYMQFVPEEYPAGDYKFRATSSLGIIAREYEVTQLVQLLQTMSPESPLYPALVQSIVENMNLSNREQLIATLQKAAAPDPEALQRAQEAHQATMRYQASQTAAFAAQAEASRAQAHKYHEEAEAVPKKVMIEAAKAAGANEPGDADEKEFERRMRVFEAVLAKREDARKQKELDLKEKSLQAKSDLAQAPGLVGILKERYNEMSDPESEAELLKALGSDLEDDE